MSDKLSRITALPCVKERDGIVTVTFQHQAVFTTEMFYSDPMLCMTEATRQLEIGALRAVAEKREVLRQIESGENRYAVVPGGFKDVGKEHPPIVPQPEPFIRGGK